MIYVASPYSNPDPVIMQTRYELVRDWTFERIKRTNESLFAPIAYCHEYALKHGMPKDADFWYEFNLGFIRNSEGMYVLQLDGWSISKGVQMEVTLAKKYKIPLTMVPHVRFSE